MRGTLLPARMRKNEESVEAVAGTAAGRIVPWVLSIGVHIGLAAVAFLITWSVIREDPPPPQLVTADWHEVSQDALPSQPMAVPQEPTPKPATAEPRPAPIEDGLAMLERVARGDPVPTIARREIATEVSFMGLDAKSARRVVYVVDASGSMLLHLSSVIRELDASLRGLHAQQQFSVVFFQQDRAITVPPRNLVAASGDHIDRALAWIGQGEHVVPAGSSDPTNAIRSAFSLKPDLIYLLSENITGAGRFEVSGEDLLAELDRLNPVDPRNDRRPVRIDCIQFLTPDPEGILKQIAEHHGGPDGYTFIDRRLIARGQRNAAP